MPYRTLACAALAATVAGTAGCATGGARTEFHDAGGYFERAPTSADNVLVVDNRNWSNMTIYLIRSGVRARVGSVGSMSTTEIRLPRDLMAGDVAVLARPLAGRDGYVTSRLNVRPGQRIQLRLEHNLNLSSFTVR
jgi:hypothetical protein